MRVFNAPADAAQILRDQRLLEGHTQRDIATAAGTQQSAVSDWEANLCEPVLGNFMIWAAALGYHVALVPFDDPEIGPDFLIQAEVS